jgi:hypothetical protein
MIHGVTELANREGFREIGPLAGGDTAGHRHHPMPGTREGAEDELTDGGIVVDEENLLRHRGAPEKVAIE